MKILVCIKQVPDMESKFIIDERGLWYDGTDLAWRINEYDTYAIEQAVRLKEQVGDADVTVLSIGPDRAGEAIRRALASGCDRALHVVDETPHEKDPFQIAAMIAAHARDKAYDIIFTGMQSQDRGSGQVGVLLAEMLGILSVTTVIDFSYEKGGIVARRELEGGTLAVVRSRLPVLVTCQLGLNQPRFPTLPNIMKAKKKELKTIPATALLKDANRLVTKTTYIPDKKGGSLILEGEIDEVAERLIRILKDKTTVLA